MPVFNKYEPLCTTSSQINIYIFDFVHIIYPIQHYLFSFQFFIDRDPDAFVPILNFLRTKELNLGYVDTEVVLW